MARRVDRDGLHGQLVEHTAEDVGAGSGMSGHEARLDAAQRRAPEADRAAALADQRDDAVADVDPEGNVATRATVAFSAQHLAVAIEHDQWNVVRTRAGQYRCIADAHRLLEGAGNVHDAGLVHGYDVGGVVL